MNWTKEEVYLNSRRNKKFFFPPNFSDRLFYQFGLIQLEVWTLPGGKRPNIGADSLLLSTV